MVGTPGYMAPEQARGSREIDARADVFALGCVLYECICGRPAFIAENIAGLLAKILIEMPPSPREIGVDVPKELDELVMRMLAKHRRSSGPRPARPCSPELDAVRVDHRRTASCAACERAGDARAHRGSERRLVSVVMGSLTPFDTHDWSPLRRTTDSRPRRWRRRSIRARSSRASAPTRSSSPTVRSSRRSPPTAAQAIKPRKRRGARSRCVRISWTAASCSRPAWRR